MVSSQVIYIRYGCCGKNNKPIRYPKKISKTKLGNLPGLQPSDFAQREKGRKKAFFKVENVEKGRKTRNPAADGQGFF